MALSLWSFFSCSKQSPLPQEQRALQFFTVESKSNLSLLFTTFKVWGEVCVASSSEPLIQGYRVNYINNNNQWSYTQGEGTEGQEMKYWSYSADQYRFHAGAPLERELMRLQPPLLLFRLMQPLPKMAQPSLHNPM